MLSSVFNPISEANPSISATSSTRSWNVRVKVFYSREPDQLTDVINAWLEENQDKILIKSIKHRAAGAVSLTYVWVLIVYINK